MGSHFARNLASSFARARAASMDTVIHCDDFLNGAYACPICKLSVVVGSPPPFLIKIRYVPLLA